MLRVGMARLCQRRARGALVIIVTKLPPVKTKERAVNEQDALAKFRRALRKQDQRAFDDLFRAARYHVAAAAYASHLLPFETMLLAMLIEEHKRVQHLETLLERLLERMPDEAGTLSRRLPLSLEDAKIADEKGA